MADYQNITKISNIEILKQLYLKAPGKIKLESLLSQHINITKD